MASITIDPTVPVASEKEGLGATRIQNIAGWINSLLGQSATAAFTYATNPFTVDANGNVNITNAAGFTIGGAPFSSGNKQSYKHATQSVVTTATESELLISANANQVWFLQFGLIVLPHTATSGRSFIITPVIPAGSTFSIGAAAVGNPAATSGSLTLPISGTVTQFLQLSLTVQVAGVGGNITLSYSAAQAGGNVDVQNNSTLIAVTVT